MICTFNDSIKIKFKKYCDGSCNFHVKNLQKSMQTVGQELFSKILEVSTLENEILLDKKFQLPLNIGLHA
jgi:hypothetical protein